MKGKLIKLIDVKTIITLSLVAATIVFVANGTIKSQVIENLVVMAVSFYLGTKIAEKQDAPLENPEVKPNKPEVKAEKAEGNAEKPEVTC